MAEPQIKPLQPPPTTPIRLAILETDSPMPNTIARYNNYTGVFTSLFTRALTTAPYPPTTSPTSYLNITRHHVVDSPPTQPPSFPSNTPKDDPYPSLDAIDAILITGSRHSAYLNDPWIIRLTEFVKRCVDSGRIKVIGVCFGHQIVGRALGAEVKRNEIGWEVSVTPVVTSQKGREVLGTNVLRIHQFHRDIVSSFPEGAIPLGGTEVCANQGMYIPHKVITVQGHPEFTEEIVGEILEVRHERKIIDGDVFKSGMQRSGNEHDGVRIGQAFVRFLCDANM